jgi:hypothetical protein
MDEIDELGRVLEECVAAFKQKDSIMEVGVLHETKKFLASGGTPQVPRSAPARMGPRHTQPPRQS